MTAAKNAPASEAEDAAAPQSMARHIWETLKLGMPVMVARSGALVMVTADVIMTGRYDADELAYYGLGFSPTMNLYVIGLGFLTGTMVLTSQADGGGRPAECGQVWKAALAHALLVGTLFACSWLVIEPFFRLTGQAPALAAGGAKVFTVLAWSLPGMLAYQATAFFLEGIQRPKPNMVLMVVANLVNIGLNWVFIFDHGSFGGMGATGAALGTTLTRWGMGIGLIAVVLWMPDRRHYGVVVGLQGLWGVSRKLRGLGVPLGLAHGFESAVFTVMVFMAGWLGTLQLAAYQVVTNVFTIVYMTAIGMATATAVRVGNAVGRGDMPSLRRAGWAGIGTTLVLLGAVMVVLFNVREWLAGLYSEDAAVAAIAAGGLAVAALFIVADGGQGVAMGAVRGMADVWVSMGLMICGFWVTTVPVAWWLAFHLEQGVPGLVWGLGAGAFVAMVLLMGRFWFLSSRRVDAAV